MNEAKGTKTNKLNQLNLTTMFIGDANKEQSFGTNLNGYDVIKIHRYIKDDIPEFAHKNELLTDEQWQKVIDAIDEALRKLEF